MASRELGNKLVNELCAHLQNVPATNYSLEMQIWWRDHKKADRKRLNKEIKTIKTERERKAALAKLTIYERKLLGLD